MKLNTDVLIVGAGITGCSVARELSRYNCSVTVIDRENDIAEGATKANSGIVHAGYDAVSGSRKAYYNVAGAALFPDLCESLGVPYRRTGALVIAFSDDEKSTLVKLMNRGIKKAAGDFSLFLTSRHVFMY